MESISDYQRYFQPFHIRQDVTVAPIHQFTRDESAIQTSTAIVDKVLSHPEDDLPTSVCQRLDTVLPACASRRVKPRGRTHPHTAKELISFLNAPPASINPYILLKYVPRKHLQFAEDVRPAYNGTFTRRTRLTPRNPFKRDPETFAYDYDSEAEWEIEPDGENLDDDSAADDEEGSMMGDSGDEEDRAFLDDEDDENTTTAVPEKTKVRSAGKRYVAPLVAMIKGVCWEVDGVQNDEILASMKGVVLLFDEKGDVLPAPIDPLSSEYWAVEMPPPAPKVDSQMILKKVNGDGGVEVVKGTSKTKHPFADALLGDFCKAIHGNNDNKAFLVEILKKKQFSHWFLTNIDFLRQQRK